MTNKKIPEALCVRVDADGVPRIEDTSDGNCHIGFSYVRADLLQGDPNEPLADGQLRWVKSSQDGKWIVGEITNYGEGSDFFCNSDRFDGDMPIEDYFKIGPVIRPPADTTN